MPNQQQSSIKFSLEESVFFRSGQEVDELLSISLSPNITVLKEGEFVILKGALELSGEYKRAEESEREEKVTHLEGKYVQQVDEREEGNNSFAHQFPVYITIPETRIIDLDDLSVEVDSFDYHFPENSSLQLEAELYVHGLKGEETNMNEKAGEPALTSVDVGVEREAYNQLLLNEVNSHLDEKVEKNEQLEPSRSEQTDESSESSSSVDKLEFEEEIKVEIEKTNDEIKQEVEREQQTVAESVFPKENISERMKEIEITNQSNEDLFESFAIETRAKVDRQEELAERPAQQNFEFPFPQLPQFQTDLDLLTKGNRETDSPEQTEESSSSSSTSSADFDESSSVESVESVADEEEHEEEIVKKKKDKYQTMSFAEFFARKEEETISAKLKVCLVQQNDSIEKIAEKYDVSVQQLLRANELGPTDDVYEGQVLYIPEKTAYRK